MLKRSFILITTLFCLFSFSSYARLIPNYKMSEEAEVTMVFDLHTTNDTILPEEAWDDFVAEEIAPEFPNGFIITSADKYTIKDDELFKWPIKVMTGFMMNNKTNLKKLSDINQAYEDLTGRTTQLHIERTLLYYFPKGCCN